VSVLWAILWVLLALILLLLLALALPVRLRLHAQSEPARQLRLELGLLGGLVPWIAIYDSTRPRKAKPTKQKKQKKLKWQGGKGGQGARMLQAGPRLLRGILGCIRVDWFYVNCVFGLGDPAETGQVFGLLAPLQYGTAWAWGRQVDVVLAPDFGRVCLDGKADVALAVTPIHLVPPAARFVWASFGPVR